MSNTTQSYAAQCTSGREAALADLMSATETGDLPKLLSRIRVMANDGTGVSVGYLTALVEAAMRGLKA